MSDYAIETIKENNKILNFYQDEDSESPREWGNLGKMVCFHNRYELGDETFLKVENFEDWEGLKKFLIEKENAVLIYPLYLYDHSGFNIKIGSYSGILPEGHARFDSGQVGFIYATKEDIRKEFSVKKVTKELLKKTEKILNNEVENYNAYLSGNVFSYTIEKSEECKSCKQVEKVFVEGCSGYYDYESMKEEALLMLKSEGK